MDGSDLADRMAISFTGVLTSVAYQFIVAESLPRHIYNTFLDNFVLFSFVMMALTIVENICVSMLLKQEKKVTRERINRMESRIAMMMESSRSMVAPIDETRSLQLSDSLEGSANGEGLESQKKADTPGDAHENQKRPKKMSCCFDKFCACINPPGTGEEKAEHLDRTCRYIFPLLYVVGVSILAGVQVAKE